MLRKLAPILSVLISMILDTAVIPALYNGIFAVPLSLIVVIAIGILLGRMRGMLYGMIAGLLIDITVGTIGMKTFPYPAIGFLIGFLLDRQDIFTRMLSRSERLRQSFARAMWVFILVALYETAMLVLQYFSNAVFEWIYVRNLLIRTGMVVVLYFILHPLFRRIFVGSARNGGAIRRTREVKSF